MHLLLVQFERDSAVYTPEEPAAGEQADDGSSSREGDRGGRNDVGEVAVVSLSPASSAACSTGGFVQDFNDVGGVGEGGVESDLVSFFSGGGGGGGVVGINSGGGGGDKNNAIGGIVIGPMDDGGAVGEHDPAAAASASAAAATAAVSGGGTSEGESATGRNNNNNNNDSDDDRCSSSIRSRSSSGSGRCECDSIDDDEPLDGSPRAPAAAAAAGTGADGTPFTFASDPGDASSGSPAAITLPRGPPGGTNTEMVRFGPSRLYRI